MLSGKMLLLAGAAALLPTLVGRVAAQPAEAPARGFVPPESPLVLTRTVWRTLGDGKEIVVRRRYAVQFIRQGDGFQLNGRLLDAAVEAPPVLAALAEIERGRSDEGLFPMLLDAAGQIRPQTSNRSGSQQARDDARLSAQNLLANSPIAAAQRTESSAFLSQLATQGGMAAWPADLFNPVASERREQRRIALPSGQEGQVAVLVRSLGAQPGGLPHAVERTVTTVLAGTSRTTRERWTLARSDQP